MGQKRPTSTDIDGDESVLSPRYQDAGLLSAQRGTDKTSRLETDVSHNLYVNVAAGSLTLSGTQDVNILSSVPLTVSGPLTDVQLRATPVPVSGTFFQATQPVSGTFFQATQPVSGPLTDLQLRATPVPISGTVVTGGLTDVQLRATPVAVSGTFFQATQPVSAVALPLPANAAQETGGNLASAVAALQIMDDWDESDRAKVNPIVGQAGVQGGAGAVSANTQRVIIATDQTSIPVTQSGVAGTLANGAETAVAGSAVQIAASNASRKILIVQNTGVANVRVGITGVTITTGLRLTPGDLFIFEMPFCPQAAIFAIREGAISSTVLAQEIT